MQKIEPISYHQYVDDYNARWTGNLKKCCYATFSGTDQENRIKKIYLPVAIITSRLGGNAH